jgi:teichuronic acid biosynthesis glycosyltransferase TuaC
MRSSLSVATGFPFETIEAAPDGAGPTEPPLRLLVLARSYPNPEFPLLGLWTQRLAQCVTSFAEVKVVSPVPYAPPLPPVSALEYLRSFRRVPRSRWDGAVEVLHPRLAVGPAYTTRGLEGLAYAVAAGAAARRLRRRFRFDLIHAHFTYPDGFAACLIGRRYGIPVVITEHVPWGGWMGAAPLVRRQARWAASACDAHLPVSSYVRRTIAGATDGAGPVHEPIPMLVDGETFKPANVQRRRGQVLFVGAVRHAKGVDVLLDALARLRQRLPHARLVIAGEPFYRSYRREFEALQALARAGGIEAAIEFVGRRSPAEVALLMSESEVVVVPSRAESFGAVLIEALACGTPVVATRSGGPEDIVTSEVGQLVPVEDASALADALAEVLEQPDRYDRATLRRYALEHFGRNVIAARLAERYEALLGRPVRAERG